MATPVNPLDRYVTYTYHFELYATPTVDALATIPPSGLNDRTDRDKPNGLLLLNTRKDAHQHIQNVEFEYLAPGFFEGITLAPFSELTMTVEEPGAAFFYEKIQRAMSDYEVTNPGEIYFGLKIIFIGRTPDDKEEIYDQIPVIPLMLARYSANYTFKGGVYTLVFRNGTFGAVSLSRDDPLAWSSYTHKTLSVKANRLSEALQQLKEGLNKNYDDWLKNETNIKTGRVMHYEINIEPGVGLDGRFETRERESTAEGDKCYLSFQPDMPIIDMIHRIIQHCPEVMEQIKGSRTSYLQPLHEGAFGYTIVPRVHYQESDVLVNYSVMRYEGNSKNSNRGKYEFNFFFSGAGQNVDVINFDMKMDSSIALFLGSANSSDKEGNQSGKLPIEFPKVWGSDVVHADRSLPKKQVETDNERLEVSDLKRNSVISAPGSPSGDTKSWGTQQAQNVNTVKGAIDAMTLLIGASGPQKTLEIRGHAGLLKECWGGMNADEYAFGVKNGLWVKLNIYDENGRQFFYRDYYFVFGVRNVFSGGAFIQRITMRMIPPVAGNQQEGSNANVQTSVAPRPTLYLEQSEVDRELRGLQNKQATATARSWNEKKDLSNVSGTDTPGGAAILYRNLRRRQ